jgi:asparagine synthase (glutamine-hydrolysing)
MAKVPVNMKMRNSVTKYILRTTSKNLLPDKIVNRPKGPILVPIDKCFGKRFEEMLNDTLNERRVKSRGLFKYAYIDKLILQRKKNPFLYDRQLFALLIIEIWFQTFIESHQPLEKSSG